MYMNCYVSEIVSYDVIAESSKYMLILNCRCTVL